MQKSRILLPAVALIVITMTIAICFTRGTGNTGKTLSETCLSLSTRIAQSPGSDVGEADCETYADLKVPPLPPGQALESFQLEEGFRIEIVAHEPMVTSPVAMDIDPDGRLWVVDMSSYMPVHDMGAFETMKRERVPEGRVTVLEDRDGDGRMETRRVFCDGLILPRAIKVLSDGVLVAEPPNVWFIQDTTGDGEGDTRELVYNSYGDTSDPNVHSFPGGLIWGMDNWLHSSNDGVESLRRVGGRWQTRSFQRLGQWGMTQDNWGRLYSSSNSRPLQTHLVPYGYSERHPQFELSTGINTTIGADEPLWPAHPTGVNRGYRDGVLRADGTLRQATAVSSTVIYRGGQFGPEFVGNAFSPEPGGNLIKRYIIDGDPAEIEVEARFAYKEREFLTSTDERFRPVNIYNAPDGSLYILDMYRGLFEHASHLTDYLRDYTVKHGLHQANGQFGRIYRVVREDREIDYKTPRFSEMRPLEVVDYLRHENGQLRDQAQQVLVQCSPPEVVPSLEELVRDRSVKAYTRLHALCALEGLNSSTYEPDRLIAMALQALGDQHPRVRAAAVRFLEPAIARGSIDVLARLEQLVGADSSPFVQLQLLASLGESTGDSALDIMARILNENAGSPYFREMALTGVYQREAQLARILRSRYGWSEERDDGQELVLLSLAEADSGRTEVGLDHLTEGQRELFETGRQRYPTCMACHGAEGQGVSGTGAPLAGSKWVQQEDPKALVRIVLQGFAGGAAEGGEDISGVMPGHSYLSDKDVAALLTYIRQSWGNEAPPVDPADVARIRAASSKRREIWSPEELRNLPAEAAGELPHPEAATGHASEDRPHIVFLINQDPNNYDAHKTIPPFAGMLSREHGFQTTVIQAEGDLPALRFPDLDVLSEADLLVIFFRRAALPHGQVAAIKGYLNEGKPLVGIRTANHAFSVRSEDGEIPDEYEDWWDFVPDILGSKNRGYGPGALGTKVAVMPEAAAHPILKGVEPAPWHSAGSMYFTAPLLDEGATVLLTGQLENKIEPVAWTRTAGESRVFYTSLGHPADFRVPQFRTLLINGIRWVLHLKSTFPKKVTQ